MHGHSCCRNLSECNWSHCGLHIPYHSISSTFGHEGELSLKFSLKQATVDQNVVPWNVFLRIRIQEASVVRDTHHVPVEGMKIEILVDPPVDLHASQILVLMMSITNALMISGLLPYLSTGIHSV